MNWRSLLVTVFILTVFIFLASGCAPQGDIAYPGSEAGNDTEAGQEADEEENQDVVSPVDGENNGDEPAGKEDGEGEDEKPEQPSTVRVVLYFADEEAVRDDIPGETGYLKAVTRDCPYTLEVLRLALQELIRGPLPEESGLGRTIPASTKINSLAIEDGIALIDFSMEVIADAPGGTCSGTLFIQSMVYTATQFPTVDLVLVTVEGEPWSDGHSVWEEPIGRDDVGF